MNTYGIRVWGSSGGPLIEWQKNYPFVVAIGKVRGATRFAEIADWLEANVGGRAFNHLSDAGKWVFWDDHTGKFLFRSEQDATVFLLRWA